MASIVLHDFSVPWTSTDPARLAGTATAGVAGAPGMVLTAAAGAAGVALTYTPDRPLDLRDHDELRFWTRAEPVADGSPARPFLLELRYTDAGDLAEEEHCWLVPVNRPGVWEQHRIGLDGDRRAAVSGFALRCRSDRPFRLTIAELLATTEDPLADVEAALAQVLTAAAASPGLPGLTGLAVHPAAVGATSLTVGLNQRLRPRNVLTISGLAGARYAVTAVTHDPPAGTTRLTVAPPLGTAIIAGATVSVLVPVVVEESPLRPPAAPGDLPDPVLLLALSDQREEPERGWNIHQRDSFRPRGEHVACSVRPPARPVLVEYQILAAATDRTDSLAVRAAVLGRLGIDTGLRVNGAVLPVRTLAPPPLTERHRDLLAPVYVQVGTRIETGPRREVSWVRSTEVRLEQLPPGDQPEEIVIQR